MRASPALGAFDAASFDPNNRQSDGSDACDRAAKQRRKLEESEPPSLAAAKLGRPSRHATHTGRVRASRIVEVMFMCLMAD